jgi:hypothetical protein
VHAETVDRHMLRQHYTLALGLGALGAAALMMLLLGVRPDLAAAAQLPMFWVKLAFPAALLGGALLGLLQVSLPNARLERVAVALAAPIVAMWLLAVVVMFGAAPGARIKLLFGETWLLCPLLIGMLSMPLFAALLWAMKDATLTRPALAGAAAGLLSGAGGALVYALHCPEMAAPFIGIWYLLGMLIPAGLGATFAPRLLRD